MSIENTEDVPLSKVISLIILTKTNAIFDTIGSVSFNKFCD